MPEPIEIIHGIDYYWMGSGDGRIPIGVLPFECIGLSLIVTSGSVEIKYQDGDWTHYLPIVNIQGIKGDVVIMYIPAAMLETPEAQGMLEFASHGYPPGLQPLCDYCYVLPVVVKRYDGQ